MATGSAYRVLEVNHSSSSSAEYELRLGGDFVLYCECLGWKNNKPAPGEPKKCKHTKSYVAKNPGMMYGPPGRFASESPSWRRQAEERATGRPVAAVDIAEKIGRRKAVAPAAPVPTTPAPKNWKDVFLNEALAAEARGVRTPESAQRAFEQEIGRFANLDVEEAIGGGSVGSAAGARALDVE